MSVRKILNQSQVSVFHDKQILVNSVLREEKVKQIIKHFTALG